MVSRPDKPLWIASRVVKATTKLTWPQKAIWLELHTLDQGEQGAFISARSLAARIGLSEPAVEKRRQELIGLGLLVAARGGRRTASWYVTLPDGCEPTTKELSVEQVGFLAARLDRAVAAARSARKPMSPGVVTMLHGRRGEKRSGMSPGAVTVSLPAPHANVTPRSGVSGAIVTPVSAAEGSNVTRGGDPEDSQTRISDFSPVRMNALTSEGECEREDRAIAHDGREDRDTASDWRVILDAPRARLRRPATAPLPISALLGAGPPR